jgi:hypothetical protein
LAAGQPGPNRLAVDTTSVYWIDFLWNNALGGAVLKAPLAGGTPQMIASGLNVPWDIAVDPSGVYWTTTGTGTDSGAEQGNEGSVMMLGFGNPTPTVLASGQSADRLVVDSANVFWTNEGTPPGGNADGAVMTLCPAVTIANDPF